MANNRELSQFANSVGYNGGNIGIGTDNPATNLHISSTGTPTIQITDEDNSGIVKIENGSGSLFLNADTGDSVSNSRIGFNVDGNERLRIDSDGRLLLGSGAISLPKGSGAGSFDLDNGSITMCIGGNINSTGRTNSTDKIARFTAPHYTNAEQPVLVASAYNVSGSNTISYGGGTSLCNTATSHIFYTAADTTTVTGTERLRINSSGLVSLGSEPSSGAGLLNVKPSSGDEYFKIRDAGDFDTSLNGVALDVRNSANNASKDLLVRSQQLVLWQNTTERLRINSDGEVGIGTDNPQVPLHVFGNTRVRVGTDQVFSVTSTAGVTQLQGINEAADTFQPLDIAGSIVTLSPSSSEALRVNSSGDVGINTTSNNDGAHFQHYQSEVRHQSFQSTNGDLAIVTDNNSNPAAYIKGTGTADLLKVVDNSTTVFLVEDGGNVTTPSQPRFFATRSATYTGYNGQNTGNTWIAYNNTIYNVGGGFKTSGDDLGLFVAPVSGLYLFHAAAYKGTGTADWTQSWFNVNSSRANGTDFVHSSTTRFAQNAIQVYMTAGQKIGFHPYNNQTNNEIITTGNHTWFKGCLLG